MALTSIGSQKTPGRPIELTFAAETGLPSDNQEVLLIGHRADGAASGNIADYTLSVINNSGDLNAASGEAAAKFGEGSELQKMVVAAIRATAGLGTVPRLKCIALKFADTDFGAVDAALTEAAKYKHEFAVSPYDGADATLRTKLRDHAILVSGAQRVENNQFGTVGVIANQDEADPSNLALVDTPALFPIWLRDSSGDFSNAELASACAARAAANPVPFNPLDSADILGVSAPENASEWISVGAGLESESCLARGWTPLYVKANGNVAFVRTVTGRISPDGTGTPEVTAYYDLQDFQVLYFWRKTLFTRFSQADFKRRKASVQAGKLVKSELIRLAKLFEEQNMFQAVDQLSKFFQVERNVSDRHRFDYKTPVNVIPGLHTLAGNIEATTQFDTITI